MKKLLKQLKKAEQPEEKLRLAILIFEAIKGREIITVFGEKTRKNAFFIPVMFKLYDLGAYKECKELYLYFKNFADNKIAENTKAIAKLVKENKKEHFTDLEGDKNDEAFIYHYDIGYLEDYLEKMLDIYIASHIMLDDYDTAYNLYVNNNKDIRNSVFRYKDLFKVYFKIKELEKKIKPSEASNLSLYNEIARVYFEDFRFNEDYSTKKAQQYLTKIFKIEPNNIEALVLKIRMDYDKNNNFETANKAYLDLLKTNKNAFLINSYSAFYYPYRGNNKGTKYCIALCETLIETDELLNYNHLARFYDQFDETEKEFKAYLEAEKRIKTPKDDPYMYYSIAWYYDEVLESYKEAITYYQKYLKHNSVWCGGQSEEIEERVKELKNKI